MSVELPVNHGRKIRLKSHRKEQKVKKNDVRQHVIGNYGQRIT